jgi:tricorn protease
MKLNKLFFGLIVAITLATISIPDALAANLIHGMRFPALSPDGKYLLFSYQGDIWKVSATGGAAIRLTVNDAYESRCRFSPDSAQIAFSSSRFGNSDIFVMPAEGSNVPTRITFSSEYELLENWYPDGKNLMITAPGPMNRYNMFRQDLTGGMKVPLFEDTGNHVFPCITPDSKKVYYLRSIAGMDQWRTGYKGSADNDIWCYDIETGKHELIYEDNRNQEYMRSGHDGTYLLFVDFTEPGIANLARLDLKTKEIKYLTNYKDDTVRRFDVDKNGNIVFQYMNDLWRLEPGKSPTMLAIYASAEDKTSDEELRVLQAGIEYAAVSPDNKLVSVGLQGDVYAYRIDGEVDNKGVAITDTSESLDTEPVFTKDGKSLYYLANEGWGNSLKKTDLASMKKETIIDTDFIHNVQRIPSTDLLSFVRGHKDIVVYDPATKKMETISEHQCYMGTYSFPITWTPDGKYAAITDNYGWYSEIYLVDRTNKQEWNISKHISSDSNPVFSPDGRFFAFNSYKDGESIVKMIELDPKANVKKTVLIEEEKKDEETTAVTPSEEKPKEEEAAKDEEQPKEEEKKEEVKETKINFDRIDERAKVVSFTSGYNYPLGFTFDGEWLFYANITFAGEWEQASTSLWKIPTDPKSKEGPQNLGQAPDGLLYSNDAIYAIMNGKVYNFSPAGPGEELPFVVQRHVDNKKEAKLAYLLVGQILKESFYDEKMHGVDWDKARKKYLTMLDDARTPEDISDLMNRLNGDLNASHLGAWGQQSVSGQPDSTASLGIEWDPFHTGKGLKVKRIYKDGPADKPDIEVKPGDIVIKIDGKDVGMDKDPAPLLNQKIDEVVTLTIDDSFKGREVMIKAADGKSEMSGVYQAWVDDNRKKVDELSGGKLGYLHISQMDDYALQKFEKEFYNLTMEKKGIVIDVRYNPGGRIHEELIDILDRRMFGYSSFRDSKDMIPQPFTYSRTPTVVLINEACTSDSEIFPYAYKQLNLGKLIGMETYGAVIGTTWVSLPGGYGMGLPSEGWFRTNLHNLENEGVKPDIEVPFPPDAYGKNQDPQIERAVQELLKQIK